MNNSNNNVRVIAIVAIILIAGGALTYALVGKRPSTTTQTATTTDSQTPATPAATTTASSGTTGGSASSSIYKDGTYSATGSYMSPGGDEKIGVTVTLKNDIITDTSVNPEPVSPEGHQFQAIFAANYKQLVVGKDISTVHLTKVSGSSLTPGGFDDALTQIEAQAKA